jgi:hypothetical protein
MATSCTVNCGTIGVASSNQELLDSLSNRYTLVGANFCAQLAEMTGCYTPTDRSGFVRMLGMGPRGPRIEQTNPSDPDLQCTRHRKARHTFIECEVEC